MSLNILMKTQECTCGAFKTSPLRFYGQLNWPLFIVYPEKLSKNSCNLSIRFLNFVTIHICRVMQMFSVSLFSPPSPGKRSFWLARL